MKVLFATGNPAKAEHFRMVFDNNGVEVVTLKDIVIRSDIDESGKNPKENAVIKAKICYDETSLITVATDDGLYIEGLSEEMQPGTHVRRVGNKRLSDTEMIEYYSDIVRNLNGRVNVYWLKCMIVYDGKEMKSYEYKVPATFKTPPSKIIREGYPLDSMFYIEKMGKYRSELAGEELIEYTKERDSDVLKFLDKALEELKNGNKEI